MLTQIFLNKCCGQKSWLKSTQVSSVEMFRKISALKKTVPENTLYSGTGIFIIVWLSTAFIHKWPILEYVSQVTSALFGKHIRYVLSFDKLFLYKTFNKTAKLLLLLKLLFCEKGHPVASLFFSKANTTEFQWQNEYHIMLRNLWIEKFLKLYSYNFIETHSAKNLISRKTEKSNQSR